MKKVDFKKNKIIKYAKIIISDWRLYVLLLPMVIWYALWIYKPMGGLLIAFKNFKPNLGIGGSDFVGFTNFITLMNGPYST